MGVMRRWFGPSREEIWRQLSTRWVRSYVESRFWKGDKVEATHREWIVTLDTYAVSTGKTDIDLYPDARALCESQEVSLHDLPKERVQRHRQISRHAGHRDRRAGV